MVAFYFVLGLLLLGLAKSSTLSAFWFWVLVVLAHLLVLQAAMKGLSTTIWTLHRRSHCCNLLRFFVVCLVTPLFSFKAPESSERSPGQGLKR